MQRSATLTIPTPASGPVNAYGKHGKWVRWRVVSLHYDHGWGAQDIFMHVNSGGDKDLSLRTVYNILEIFYGTGDVKTEHSGQRVVEDPTLFLATHPGST